MCEKINMILNYFVDVRSSSLIFIMFVEELKDLFEILDSILSDLDLNTLADLKTFEDLKRLAVD